MTPGIWLTSQASKGVKHNVENVKVNYGDLEGTIYLTAGGQNRIENVLIESDNENCSFSFFLLFR